MVIWLRSPKTPTSLFKSSSPSLRWRPSRPGRHTTGSTAPLTCISRYVLYYIVTCWIINVFVGARSSELKCVMCNVQEHPSLSKSEKKRLCGLMDCKKLTAEASSHAVQNERLPLRLVVQVLFFEQVRTSAVAASDSDQHP